MIRKLKNRELLIQSIRNDFSNMIQLLTNCTLRICEAAITKFSLP